jgi:hypothetical protein
MTNKEKLGKLGEELVAKLFNGTLSSNKYDMKKDLVLNESNTNVEVKTQNRDKYRNMFTVNIMHKNQVQKCVSVDRLFFVEYDTSENIKIWECLDRTYKIFETRDGRLMAGWDINKMKILADFRDEELTKEMKSFSQSRDFSLNSPYAINKF